MIDYQEPIRIVRRLGAGMLIFTHPNGTKYEYHVEDVEVTSVEPSQTQLSREQARRDWLETLRKLTRGESL